MEYFETNRTPRRLIPFFVFYAAIANLLDVLTTAANIFTFRGTEGNPNMLNLMLHNGFMAFVDLKVGYSFAFVVGYGVYFHYRRRPRYAEVFSWLLAFVGASILLTYVVVNNVLIFDGFSGL